MESKERERRIRISLVIELICCTPCTVSIVLSNEEFHAPKNKGMLSYAKGVIKRKAYLFEFSVELSGLASLLQFLLNALRFLDILISGILGLTFLLSKGNTVVSLIPGSERSGIDLWLFVSGLGRVAKEKSRTDREKMD